MTDIEATLLRELRRLKVWELGGGSFQVHLQTDGFPAKIEVTKPHKIDRRLSTSDEILALSNNPV